MKSNVLKLGTISLALAIALSGCGGGGGGGGDSTPQSGSSQSSGSSSSEVAQPVTYSEPLENEQWYLHRAVAQEMYGEDSDIDVDPILDRYTGKGVKVGFLVARPDLDHEDLKDRIKEVYNFGNGTDPLTEHDTSIMGPAVASVNRKGIRGVAPEADVYILNVLYPSTDQDYINAFKKAGDIGLDVLIVTSSTQNGGDKQELVDAIKYAIDKGVAAVFSAGNEGIDLKDMNPEYNFPEAIIVGGHNGNNYPTSMEYASNYGENLDVMAPFSNIITTLPNNQYDYKTGTSQSAPIVGGIVALMKQANPNLTPAQIDEILHKTAVKIDDLDCNYDDNGKSYMCGYGKVDAAKAVEMALGY